MLSLTLLASCTTQHLAEIYFRQAADFMPVYNPVYPAGVSRPDGAPRRGGSLFDFRSLMIFDSLVGRAAGQQGYPLVSTRRERRIIMGGNNDPDLAGPSYDDISRLSALYPPPPPPIESFNLQDTPGAPPGKRSVTANDTEPTQPWLRVEGPGGFTTAIGPVPSEQPTEAPAANRSTKRWYSVPLEQDAPTEAKHPWPTCNDGTRTINYCFEDEASHKELAELFARGLAKWAPAMHVSSLVFAPDAACTGDLHSRCLCSTPGVEENTLHIMLTEDGSPQATVGYLPSSVAVASGRPRHHIAWPDDPDLFGAGAHLIMAHEIGKLPSTVAFGGYRMFHSLHANSVTGHVVGFGHEHQRPDARGKVKFDCLALGGYDEAKKKVEAIGTDGPMFTPNMSIQERMDLV